MEGIILSISIVAVIAFLCYKISKLKEETQFLNDSVVSYMKDYDRILEDHKSAELELRLTQVKLDGLKQYALTPDNSVPKDLHIEKVFGLSTDLQETKAELQSMTQKFEESRGKQISNRVKMGQIGEQFSTLLSEFKYNRKETKAILQPIDFVCFEEDEVIFIEVKTGESKLSSKQRRIRDNINAGRVKFEVFRINDSGAEWE